MTGIFLVISSILLAVFAWPAQAMCQKRLIETIDCAHAVTIATGSAAISAPTAIDITNTGPGTVRITTGSGSINGTVSSGIVGTTQGALHVTIGSGGVGGQGNAPAIALTSQNGNISITANGDVSVHGQFPFVWPPPYVPYVLPPPDLNNTHGLLATSNGAGNITVDGSGAFFGQTGRGIYAFQSSTGLGGISILGAGETISGTTAVGCCSAIRAQIANPADASNIFVDRTGDIFDISTLLPPEMAVSAGIHALTAGAGNITVLTSPGSLISSLANFGLDA